VIRATAAVWALLLVAETLICSLSALVIHELVRADHCGSARRHSTC
jgi:hypothetical protein